MGQREPLSGSDSVEKTNTLLLRDTISAHWQPDFFFFLSLCVYARGGNMKPVHLGFPSGVLVTK